MLRIHQLYSCLPRVDTLPVSAYTGHFPVLSGNCFFYIFSPEFIVVICGRVGRVGGTQPYWKLKSLFVSFNEQCKYSHQRDSKAEARRGNEVMGVFQNGQGGQSAMIKKKLGWGFLDLDLRFFIFLKQTDSYAKSLFYALVNQGYY